MPYAAGDCNHASIGKIPLSEYVFYKSQYTLLLAEPLVDLQESDAPLQSHGFHNVPLGLGAPGVLFLPMLHDSYSAGCEYHAGYWSMTVCIILNGGL